MYRVPSRKRKNKQMKNLNLIPILDAVFIFIFFLLFSASFMQIFEVPSDVPLVSSGQPPKNKKPLALTLVISSSQIEVMTGIPSRRIAKIAKSSAAEYDLNHLHEVLVGVKQKHPHERDVILEPRIDIEYEGLIKIMDSIRELVNTDPAIFIKDKDGLDMKEKRLFDKVVFGNIQS